MVAGVPDAIAISSTTFKSWRSAGTEVSGIEQSAAELLRDDPTSAPELRDLEQGSAAHHNQRAHHGDGHQPWVAGKRPVDRPGRGISTQVAHRGRQEQVDRHHDRQHGEHEQEHEAARVSPGEVLTLEKVCRHALK